MYINQNGRRGCRTPAVNDGTVHCFRLVFWMAEKAARLNIFINWVILYKWPIRNGQEKPKKLDRIIFYLLYQDGDIPRTTFHVWKGTRIRELFLYFCDVLLLISQLLVAMTLMIFDNITTTPTNRSSSHNN